jgi:hypothetical protein
VVLHPSSLLLRGSKVKTTIAHGLVVEGLTATDSYQTTDARAQDIERQIRKVWARLNSNCSAHTNSPWLSARLEEITAEVAELGVSYDEWQIIYRQLLQLARALRGEPQLLANNDGENMDEFDRQHSESRDLDSRSLTTVELFSRIASKTTLLVNKEIDLLREESREDLRSELASIKGLAAAAVAAIAALNLALTAAVFALASHMAPVSAALILAAIALAIAIGAAAIAWRKHVEQPLDLTRKTVKEDVQWAKEQMA